MELFNEVWNNIVSHQGEQFHTKKGLPFTYSITSEGLITSRNSWHIRESNFSKAYRIGPPITISDWSHQGVIAASYVWAILNDERILGW